MDKNSKLKLIEIKEKISQWKKEGYKIDELEKKYIQKKIKQKNKLSREKKSKKKVIVGVCIVIFIILFLATIYVYSGSFLIGSEDNNVFINLNNEVNEVIIIGTSADFPPFEYFDDGNIVGFDIELTKGILEDLGYTVGIKDIPFDSLITSIQTGKIDVIAAAMMITADREEQVDFTEPYYEADQSILVRKSSSIILNEWGDLQNYRVGAQTGTTGAFWVEDLVDSGTIAEQNFSRYDTYTLAVLDLINENIDAVVLDKPVAEAFMKNKDVKIIETIITGESYGLAVKSGDTKLLNELNESLDSIRGSNEWVTLIETYFK